VLATYAIMPALLNLSLSQIFAGVILLVVVGILSTLAFFTLYLFWKRSRASAVYAVAIGIYFWTALIAVNALWVLLRPKLFTTTGAVGSVMNIAFAGYVMFRCTSVVSAQRPDLRSVELWSDEQSKLWAILKETAARCGVEMPKRIYWMAKPNAEVVQTGGWLGLGAKPALGIGLPLLRVLNVDEFQAAVAHEFHHLRRGDAFLSAAIHSARRLSADYQETPGSPWLGFLTLSTFARLYASVLHKLSNPVIRNWEFEADHFAALKTSPALVARALVKIELAQRRFAAFEKQWARPTLDRGLAPPLMTRFWEYYRLCAKESRNHRRLLIAREMGRRSETHPALRDRLLRLAEYGPLDEGSNAPAAYTLLEEAGALELRLYGSDTVKAADAWTAECLRHLLVSWSDDVARETARLKTTLMVGILDRLCASLPQTAATLGYPRQATTAAEEVLLKSFAIALAKDGWYPSLEAGRLIFGRGDFMIDPAQEIKRLKLRQIPDWFARCEDLRIAELVLVEESRRENRQNRTFCSRCLRTYAGLLERCPRCLKSFA
jgi:Zn-dependent protease with chaperone function